MMTQGLLIGLLLLFNSSIVNSNSYRLQDVQFEINSDQLNDKQVDELKIIIELINKMLEEGPEQHFTLWINGNSDPSEKHPRRLSDNRAEIIKEQLIKLGLANGTLIARGLGTKRPLTNSSTEPSKKRNARVDFKIGFD